MSTPPRKQPNQYTYRRHQHDTATHAATPTAATSHAAPGGPMDHAAAAAAAAPPSRPKQPNQYTKLHQQQQQRQQKQKQLQQLLQQQQGASSASSVPPAAGGGADAAAAAASARPKQPNQYTKLRAPAASTAVAAAPTAAATTPRTHPTPHSKQPNQYTKLRAVAAAASAAAAPPDAPKVAPPTPRTKQPNQYTKAAAAAASPAAATATGPSAPVATPAKQTNQHSKASAAAAAAAAASAASTPPAPRPKQPNQYTYRHSTPPKPPSLAKQPNQHTKQPNQYTQRQSHQHAKASPSGSAPAHAPAAATPPRTKQPNQYTKLRAASAGAVPGGAAAAVAAPAKQPNQYTKQPNQHTKQTNQHTPRRQPNQYPIVVASGAAPVVVHPGRKRPHVIRDNGQQVGPFSPYSPKTHYTPPVYLNADMSTVLRRVAQVLQRDLTSRRQVAMMIGVSQSKISRLLHGRSPFRNADEEWHLRHWLYEQEKQFVAQLQSFLSRSLNGSKLLDFSSLPSPLNTIRPPEELVLYLHFMLPLNQRAAIDTLVAKALGLDTHEGKRAEEEEEEDAPSGDDEPQQQQQQSADASSSSLSGRSQLSAGATTPMSRAERLAIRKGATVDESSDADNEVEGNGDGDGDAAERDEDGRERKRVKLADDGAPTDLTPDVDVCGTDAWSIAPSEHVRRRLLSLIALTHNSQSDIARLLGTSSGTVSLLLRGEFPFSTLPAFMHQLQQWGRITDQLIVTKAMALIGAPQRDDRGDTPAHARDDLADTTPTTPHEHDDANADAMDADDRESCAVVSLPNSAFQQLVLLLLDASIPLDHSQPDGAHNGFNRADSSSSSSFDPVPLSLSSWLRMRCSFTARTQLDELVIPWVERWSAHAHALGHSDGAGDTSDLSLWSLHHQQTQSAARFGAYLRLHQREVPLTVHAHPAVSGLHSDPMDEHQRTEHQAKEDQVEEERQQQDAEESASPPMANEEQEQEEEEEERVDDEEDAPAAVTDDELSEDELSDGVEVADVDLAPTRLSGRMDESTASEAADDAPAFAPDARPMSPYRDDGEEVEAEAEAEADADADADANADVDANADAMVHQSSTADMCVDDECDEQIDAPSDSAHPQAESHSLASHVVASTLPAVPSIVPAAFDAPATT